LRTDAKKAVMTSTTSTTGGAAVLRAFVVVAVLLAGLVALYLWQLQGLKPPGGEHLVLCPLITLGVWAAGTQKIAVRDRRASASIALDGVPILLAAAFLPPVAVLATVLAGQLATLVPSRKPLVMVTVSLLVNLFAVATAVMVYDRAMGATSPVSLTGWLLAAGLLLVTSVTSLTGIVAARAVLKWRWTHPPLGSTLLQVTLDVVLCSVGGLVAVSLVLANPWAIVLFAVLVAAADLGWHRTARAAERHASLQKLYDFTSRLATVEGGEREVVRAVLDEARALLMASRAILVAPLEAPLEHLCLRCTVDEEQPARFEEGVPLTTLALMVRERGSVLADAHTTDPESKRVLGAEGVREVLAVPLRPGEAGAGCLAVADRAFTHEGFGPADVRLLGALAANAEAVLRRTGLMEKLREEAAVRHYEATHDRLTGLANRAVFSSRMEDALQPAQAPGSGARVALVLLDLDGFKAVNDTLGHHVGDMVLAQLACRLAPLGGETTLVARVGGDEFVVLLEDAPDEDGCMAMAERVFSAVNEPIVVKDFELVVRGSVGVAASAVRRTSGAVLLRHADIAMYKAKAEGGGVRLYDAATDRSTLRRLSLATELRKALEASQLQLHYQPVVDIPTGRIFSCEALTRWSHDQFGPIAPDEFIPVAERAGLIDPLTWWVLRTALTQVKQWRTFLPQLSVAVNLSARSLATRDLAARVSQELDLAGLAPDALRLELTESSMMADLGAPALRELSALGVSLSIDDFGTGYSSLTRLRELPFHEVKIDKSFVAQMCRASEDEAVVRSVIELARGLGRMATAEGVEDEGTLDRLLALGCHSAQGFLLGRPAPAHGFTALLAAGQSQPRPGGVLRWRLHGAADLSR
jgi:diguanylate cyclase (GGDEF)-like protein